MYLINECAISKKDLTESDDVVSFPYYDATPDEPEFICCENIALRSEFEKWYLRNSVTKRVRDFWIQRAHRSKYFSILAENENILISKSSIEDNIRLFFLKYVFEVWFTEATWKRLKELVAMDEGRIDLYEDERFSWTVDSAKGSILLQLQRIRARKDAIVIPLSERQSFQELVYAIN